MSLFGSDGGSEQDCHCGNKEMDTGLWVKCSFPLHKGDQWHWEYFECTGLSSEEYAKATSGEYEYTCTVCHEALQGYYERIKMPSFPRQRVFATANWMHESTADELDGFPLDFPEHSNAPTAPPQDFAFASASSEAATAPATEVFPTTTTATTAGSTLEDFSSIFGENKFNLELTELLFNDIAGPMAPSGPLDAPPPQLPGAFPWQYGVSPYEMGALPGPPMSMADPGLGSLAQAPEHEWAPDPLQDHIARPLLQPQDAPDPQGLAQDTILPQMTAQAPLAPAQQAAPVEQEQGKKKKPQQAWGEKDKPVVKSFMAGEILADKRRLEKGEKEVWGSETKLYEACSRHLADKTRIVREASAIKNKWCRDLRKEAEAEFREELDARRPKRDGTKRATTTSTRKRKPEDDEDGAGANGSVSKKGRRDGGGGSGGSAGAAATIS
ncbi:hypothetical protein MMC10_005496 [Thelotrema lepadinum]|nr:hypothetical protein [Thelotrema lepadinum]